MLQNYKIPYPQKELNQKNGLTSKDIADALEIPIAHVNEKIQRSEFKAMCEHNGWGLIAAAIKSERRGRPGKFFIMETDVAKALVATTNNHQGWGYLKFLLECERVATELTPKLLQQNEELKKEIAYLKSNTIQKKLPGKKADSIPAAVSYADDIFGEEQVIEVRWVKKQDLTELELARAIKRHCLAVGAGAINRAKELDEKADSADRKIHYKVKKLLS